MGKSCPIIMTTIPLNQALSVFEDHLQDIKEALITNAEADIEGIEKFKKTGEPTHDMLCDDLYKLQIKQATGSKLHTIKRITARQQYLANPKQHGVSEQQIETAKAYPIEQLFGELTAQPIRRGMTNCPFHPDKTASMSLQKYNRYKCFGCDAKGSTIDLYMGINDVDFLTAVRALQ